MKCWQKWRSIYR